MTTPATKHTHSSLEAIRLKDDVIALAATMGVEAEGTRAELYARILAAQDAQLAAAVDVTTPELTDTSLASDGGATAASLEPSAAEPSATEPPATEPLAPALHKVKLSSKATASAATLVASYLGEDAAALGNGVVKALEAGKQPCIVTGTGNRRFALQVFDQPFNFSDASNDVSDVCVNIARRLASRLLYPRA